ncbi:MAG: hypothetical protein GY798_09330, partial [Hyphomicrobiales bacterium]|nr:hypothetical protein [Hyphomicrobiales bacterium]
AEAFAGRGYSHFAREDNTRALDDADSAVAVATTDPRGFVLRGDVSVAGGDLATGLSNYRLALDLIDDGDAYGQTLRNRIATVEQALAVATAASKGPDDDRATDEAVPTPEDFTDQAVADGADTPALQVPDETARVPDAVTDQAIADDAAAPAAQAAANPARALRLFAASIIVGVAGLEIEGEPSIVVTVDGEIKPGDEATFERALKSVDRPLVLVSLNNPTGDWRTAMAIGRLVWAGEFRTLVVGARCGAPCALMWLAGRPRFAASGTDIMLQRATDTDALADTELPQADSLSDPALNALVGAYLSELGLTSAAISAIAEPAPEKAVSLSSDTARRLGIAAEPWPAGEGK